MPTSGIEPGCPDGRLPGANVPGGACRPGLASVLLMPDPKLQASELVAGRWRIDRLLGQGGMSNVYRAVDQAGGDAVAVKMVRSPDPTLADRMAQEAKALAGFTHPNLVRLIDSGVHQGQAFLVMELVEGPTLSARLRQGPLGTAAAARVGVALASALDYVHGRGVVHRDLKPSNVLLGPDDRVRLADFGIARLVDASSLTLTGSTLGTAAYMAPEQIEHHGVGPAADIWSLGVILLECLTGRRTFEGTPAEVIARRLAHPLSVPAEVPGPWRLLLDAMVHHNPERRPSAADVAGMLDAPGFRVAWQPAIGRPPAGLHPVVLPAVAGDGEPAPMPTSTVTRALPTPTPTAVAARPSGPELTSPGPGSALPSDDPWGRRTGWLAGWGGYRGKTAVAVLAVLAIGLGSWALASGSRPVPRAGAAHTTRSTSTVPSTTAVPNATEAATALFRDTEQGMAAGTVSQQAGQVILGDLDSLAGAEAAGDAAAESADLGNIDAAIAAGATAGGITASMASTLVADVAGIANALGVPTTTTTTTTTLPPAPGPPGKHPGKGH